MLSQLFNFDSIALTITTLILFIAAIVGIYSKTYFRADKNRGRFLLLLLLISISLTMMVAADNVFLLMSCWAISNLILVGMMIHKASWKQARASGILALKNFAFGFVCLSLALVGLYLKAGDASIKLMLASELDARTTIIAGVLIITAAMTQSAIFPFNSWLLSSLNSPTPASAIMHAGLVNGGGILLARFAPLFFKAPDLLTLIFIIGMLTAVLGTFYKLIQSNVKGMLACSTMSQMGFMLAQCGLGLFPAAIAHLFWHGMFKAYLFLSSASVWQERRLDLGYPPKISSFCLALLCGVFGAVVFDITSRQSIHNLDTTLILILISFITASQVALTVIEKLPTKNFIAALLISSLTSALYGGSIYLVESVLDHAEILNPQPLNFWYVAGYLLMLALWIARLFMRNSVQNHRPIFMWLYVKLLNASQPSFKTVTSNRNHYNF